MDILISIVCVAAVLTNLNPMFYAAALFLLSVITLISICKEGCGLHKPLGILFILFCASFAVPVFCSDAKWGNYAIELCRIMFLIFPFILAKKRSAMLYGVFAGAVLESIIGLISYMGIYEINGFVQIIDGVKHLQSTAGYANTTCMIALCGVFCGIHLSNKHKENRELFVFLSVICLAGALLTNSRLGFACAFAAILIYFAFKNRKMLFILISLFLAGVASVAFLFLSGNERIILGSTLVSRFIYWQDALNLFFKNPFGIGSGTWGELQFSIQSAEYSVNYVHNGYMQILLEAGFLGFISFCLMIVYIILKHIKSTSLKNAELTFVAVIMLLLHIFVDVDLSFPSIYLILGILLCTHAEKPSRALSLFISCAAIIASICVLILSFNQAPQQTTLEKAEELYLADELKVTDIQAIVTKTYEIKAYEDMYIWSKRWIECAPRQQYAYEMHHIALSKLYSKTKNNTYLKEKEDLCELAEKMNRTQNNLCKYLTAHSKIVLPEMK